MRLSSLSLSCYLADGSIAARRQRTVSTGTEMFVAPAIVATPVASWANGSHTAKGDDPRPLVLPGGWTD